MSYLLKKVAGNATVFVSLGELLMKLLISSFVFITYRSPTTPPSGAEIIILSIFT